MTKTRPTQWLLIGGPGHGTTVMVKQGSRVLADDAHYEGQDYPHNGALYRIGTNAATVEQLAAIPRFISTTGLRPIGK